MNNPYPDNPVISRFLGLKNYFRNYATGESIRRAHEITKIARIIQQSGDEIAFDLLGSVNFGMADEKSDVDMVIYLDCGHDQEADFHNCPKLRFYESLILTSLIQEVSEMPFKIQVVDTINLGRLDKAIKNSDTDEQFGIEIIARFVFYRTICRGVNKRVFRPYERRIMQNKPLFSEIEEILTESLIEFTRTSGHIISFEKYIKRLKELDVQVPKSMLRKIVEYLNTSK